MKLTFGIFLQALGFYSLLTTPALVLAPMYFISLFYALLFGLAAWLVFAALFITVASIQFKATIKWVIVSIAVPLGVATAHTLIGICRFERNVWEPNGFLLFPLAAVIAGWVSLYVSRNKIKVSFTAYTEKALLQEDAGNSID